MAKPPDAEKYQPGNPPSPEKQPADVVISSDTRKSERVPPGQVRTRKWPVLDASGPPRIDLQRWRLEVFGLVERPLQFNWQEFLALPQVKVFADFHCVTRWSRLGNIWQGVSVRELLQRAGVKPEARYVMLHAYDQAWTTNLPLADFLADDTLIAHLHDGEPLTLEHGAPARAIVPRLYAWKSAKWLKAIELAEEDRPGYWERGGYHMRGDPWNISGIHPDGERYRDD